MPFSIERNDLATVAADAIVIAANEQLQITGGVGLAVAQAAGFEALQRACDDIGYCPCGSAVATPAFNLSAKTVVHVVGPVWQDGTHGEVALLRSAYDAALACAAQAGARSIATPLISAGTYGFPPDVSLSVAREAIRAFLNEHEADVRLVLYGRDSVAAGLAAYLDIAEYIDDNYVEERTERRWNAYAGNFPQAEAAAPSAQPRRRRPRLLERLEDTIDATRARFDERRRPEISEEPEERRAAQSAASLPAGERRATEEGLDADESGFAGEDLEASDAFDVYAGASIGERFGADDTPFLGQGDFGTTSAPSQTGSFAPLSPSPAPSAPSSGTFAPTLSTPSTFTAAPASSLEDMLDAIDAPFSTTLLALIDARGLTDAQVYKRANMSRQLFSKIRSDADYRPTKKTALALAIALELNLDETRDLLNRAGFALSKSSKADVIVEYHINRGNYDIFDINAALYAFDQPLL